MAMPLSTRMHPTRPPAFMAARRQGPLARRASNQPLPASLCTNAHPLKASRATKSMFLDIVRSVSAAQLKKAHALICETLSGSWSRSSEVHSQKARAPMSVTDEDSQTFESRRHPINVLSGTWHRDFGRRMSASEVHLAKTAGPSSTSDSDTRITVSVVHPQNARSSMCVIVSGSQKEVIRTQSIKVWLLMWVTEDGKLHLTSPVLANVEAGMRESPLGSRASASSRHPVNTLSPRSVTVSGRQTDLRLAQPWNARLPTEVTPMGILSSARVAHPSKARGPMWTRTSGSTTCRNERQSMKVAVARCVSPVGSSTSESDMHLANANCPISVVERGSLISVKFLHCRNAMSPRRFRACGSATSVSAVHSRKADCSIEATLSLRTAFPKAGHAAKARSPMRPATGTNTSCSIQSVIPRSYRPSFSMKAHSTAAGKSGTPSYPRRHATRSRWHLRAKALAPTDVTLSSK
mmetsp:Transcript_20971/g.54576  ORF Transcript_20971/g.54576 Transcript_20971/m.54576 type:complete len:465 (+) Transcript_20971:67-1461(+)